MGSIPDGVFDFVDNAIYVLSAPDITIDRLRKLTTVLRNTQREQMDSEEIAKRIQDEVPELSSLRDLFLRSRVEADQFCTLLIMLVGVLIQAGFCGKRISEGEARHLSDQAVEQSVGATDSALDRAERNICSEDPHYDK